MRLPSSALGHRVAARRAIRRRGGPEFVLIAGLLLTMMAVVLVPRPEVVYWTKVELTMAPPVVWAGNPLRVETNDLIIFAAAIERKYNGRITGPQSSTEATLYGEGITKGVEVRLPNSGSQWEPTFDRAALAIQVVDASQAQVQENLDRVVGQLTRMIHDVQTASGTDSGDMIRTVLVPAKPVISYVTGNRHREQAAALLVGAGVSFALAQVGWRRRLESTGP